MYVIQFIEHFLDYKVPLSRVQLHAKCVCTDHQMVNKYSLQRKRQAAMYEPSHRWACRPCWLDDAGIRRRECLQPSHSAPRSWTFFYDAGIHTLQTVPHFLYRLCGARQHDSTCIMLLYPPSCRYLQYILVLSMLSLIQRYSTTTH